MYTGGNTVEINTEAASSDIIEYHDTPIAGMFGFLCCYIACILLLYCMHFFGCKIFPVIFLFPGFPTLPLQESADYHTKQMS